MKAGQEEETKLVAVRQALAAPLPPFALLVLELLRVRA